MTTMLPPPVPTHKSPLPALNISIIEPTYNFNNKSMNTPVKRRISYLGKKPGKRYLLQTDSDCSGSSSSSSSSSEDESDTETNRFSTESCHSEEHQFWQVHSSTTIIAPPASLDYASSIKMTYTPKKKQRLALASQVQSILGSTFDTVDNEIELEWENSRTQLKDSLIVLPTLSLPSF
ncbi:hypothetical protein BD770DRAFT_397635 [Pilaira anomala]|nr:hypothetical protein BD770DRAFT_397635 [Pilaira anomala]